MNKTTIYSRFWGKTLAFVLFVAVMSSCTNWQAEYDAAYQEKKDSIMPRYEFIQDQLEQARQNKNCKVFKNSDKLDAKTIAMILSALPDEEISVSGLSFDRSNAFFLHVPGSSRSMNYSKFSHIFEESIFDQYDCAKVKNEEKMKQVLRNFKYEVMKPISKSKYLVIAQDQILVKPVSHSDGFDEGVVLCLVQVYDLNTFEELDSHLVAATNSSKVTKFVRNNYSSIDQDDLMRNLYDNLESNIIRELKVNSPVRFQGLK